MPWYKGDGYTLSGMDTFVRDLGNDTFEKPGAVWIGMGVILAGLGIAAFFAGRQIALAIVTLVMTVLALFISFLGVGVVADQKKFDELFTGSGNGGSAGIGVVLGIVATLVAIAGAIVVLAKRRRPAM
jgi:Na+/melibiose symporter-like transporter